MNKIDNTRPRIHFSPKKNWMNDPNGMVYFDGEYHLFFQHNPDELVWGPMHWGHAVSKDMIHWEELDIALYPDEHGTIFSGSAVVDWDNTTGFFEEGKPGLVAIFTHSLESVSPPVQTQSIAYSKDKGRTWTKYEGNPVLKHESKVDFRDPKVFWFAEEQKWLMSLATGRSISFYSSKNLIDWDFESEFGEGAETHYGVWECPDLFKLKVEGTDQSKWVLFVSIGDGGNNDIGSRTQYFIGDFDGSTFTPDSYETVWLDNGKDNYAGVTFSDIPKEDGRRIYMAWMNNWRYANEIPTKGWRGQMSLPRVLTIEEINSQLRVIQKPVAELNEYFEQNYTITNREVSDSLSIELESSCVNVGLDIQNNDSETYEVKLYHTKERYSSIIVDNVNSTLTVTRDQSGEIDFSDMFKLSQTVAVPDTKRINIQIILDVNSNEIFINNGQLTFTNLIFPENTIENVIIEPVSGSVTIENAEFNVLK